MQLLQWLFGTVQWAALGVNVVMGVLFAGSFTLYAWAAKGLEAPTVSAAYMARLIFHPYFILATILSFLAVVMRFWLFNWLGAQRTWFVTPMAFVVTTVILAAVFREKLGTPQWAGVALILAGVVLVAKD